MRCSAPLAKPTGADHLLESRIASEIDLDPAVRLKLEEELEALRDPDISEEEELERWKRVRRYASTAWEVAGVKTGRADADLSGCAEGTRARVSGRFVLPRYAHPVLLHGRDI